jgi:hypothetical protein
MLGVVRDATGATVCTLGDREDADAQNATAALICAAPDLLVELGAIVRLIECPFDRAAKKEEALLEAALRARAVIARAEGGAT